jgi:DNA-binding GntR family transcriptional regulator
VTIVPNRGPIVTRIDAAEAADLYEVRSVLEALATRQFADRASDEQVEALRAAVDRVEHEGRRSQRAFLEAKDDFYDVLLTGGDNAVITRVLDSLRARISHLRAMSVHRPGRFDELMVEFHGVVSAVERRDGEAAREHVRAASIVALEVLTEENARS